jgi:type IV pilus assembly protein PilX
MDAKKKSTHSTPRSEARGILRVDTERRFLPRFKNRGLAPSNVSILRNQSGVALIIALIMIVVLTLIGLASTYTSTFEIKLSGNKRGSTDAFYTADGGAQSVLANLTNFRVIVPPWTAVTPPIDLQNESIDWGLTAPTLSLPAGVNFTAPPQVTIYHTTRTGAPRGLGFSATGNIEYEHYIVDSLGRDQMDSSLIRSNSQVREKVVRLVPTSQGGGN